MWASSRIVATLVVLVVGCSSRAPCADRSGTYGVKYAVHSGNCGSIPEQTVTIGGDGDAVTTACTSKPSVSSDNCAVTVDVTCPDGTTSHGTITWDTAGASATGTLQLTSPICSGTYDVTYTRR